MHLNFFPVNFQFDKFQVKTKPYTEENLFKLRKDFNTTHSFFRNEDLIYISNKDGDDDLISGDLVERDTFYDWKVTSSLVKHIFFRTFKDRFPNYTPVDFYPFRFFSGQDKDDIVFKLLPEHLRNRIAYKKLIEIQLRKIEIGGIPRFGFLINIKRNWIFNKNCLELKQEGYDLVGLDVLHTEQLPGLDKVLAPNEEFIGVISEVNGETAKVQTNEGEKDYPLEELILKKTKYNIGNYLAFATSREKSEEILGLIESKRSEIYNPSKQDKEIKRIASYMFSVKKTPILFQNKDGFCFEVATEPLNVNNTINLRTPTFIFDYASTKTNDKNPDIGLSNFGPYDSINFDIKTPNVLCLCNRTNRGSFSKFLSNLKDGDSQSRYFKKGLLKKYDLQDVIFNIIELQSLGIEDYVNAISNYDENKPHLAIIEIPARYRKLEDINNPYYRIKAKLLTLEIPVQFVTTEIINRHNEYILNSIALQIYAKLGGTPWVLPSQKSVDREIVIGIGHSWIRKNQYVGSEQNRVVGITTFLSSDGQYLLGDKVKDVSFDNYFDELLKSLKVSIQRVSTEQGWGDGETVRLIFHIFKPIKSVEFDVVSELVQQFDQYKIKFAFVTISRYHPFKLFDKNQQGISRYGSTSVKGRFVPNRGSNVFLDSETCIVQMFGANELKTSKQGVSPPMQIRIRKPEGKQNDDKLNDMLFYDLSYIVQQIFSFTYLSWRSFLPGDEPATMKYSNLISRLLGKMRNMPGWDADSLNYGLKRKKWFL